MEGDTALFSHNQIIELANKMTDTSLNSLETIQNVLEKTKIMLSDEKMIELKV